MVKLKGAKQLPIWKSLSKYNDFLTLQEAVSKTLKCVTTAVPTIIIEEHLAHSEKYELARTVKQIKD